MLANAFRSEHSFAKRLLAVISTALCCCCSQDPGLIITNVYPAPISKLEIHPPSQDANIIDIALVVEFRLRKIPDNQYDSESGAAQLSICGSEGKDFYVPSLVHRNKDGKLLALFPYSPHQRTFMDGPEAKLGWPYSKIQRYGECFSLSNGGVAWKSHQSKSIKIHHKY